MSLKMEWETQGLEMTKEGLVEALKAEGIGRRFSERSPGRRG